VLIPWSAFWDRNYFVEASATLGRLLTSNYTRGGITGLGLLNVWAALAELADVFGSRSADPTNPPSHSGQQSTFDNLQ
jgi:hypothetical protein